jgi:hypothetical protein
MVELPWPEDEQRARARVRAVVDSVLRPDELAELRIEHVTPYGHSLDEADAVWVALRVTVVAADGDSFTGEVWDPEQMSDWEHSLHQLAWNLEDWVCETRFAWGQQRTARVPD